MGIPKMMALAGLAVVVLLSMANVAGAQEGAGVDRFVGTFKSEALTIQLQKVDDSSLTGTMTNATGAVRWPLKARLVEGSLQGIFQIQDKAFPFTATLEGPTLSFTTGDKTNRLTKLAAPPPDAPPTPAAADAAHPLEFVGRWDGTSSGKTGSIRETWDIKANGTFTLVALDPPPGETFEGKWRIEGRKFVSSLGGEPEEGLTYLIKGDALTLISSGANQNVWRLQRRK